MRNGLISIVLGACLWAQPQGAVHAQATVDPAAEAQAAERANARGDHAAAESAYGRVLAVRPADIAALVGRGSARAFQKKYDSARADFEAALARQGDHLGALVGLAHTLAWSGRHADAMARFEQALALAPGNVDAQRGAAFTELWRGNAAASMARFERLLAQAPQDAGARLGLDEARAAVAAKGPRFEAALWMGRTRLPLGQSESGLRLAELAIWPNDNTRLFLRYDDGLSRDNAALAKTNRSAALTSVGGYMRWGGRHGTLLELGLRNQPDGVDQQILRFEHSLYLDGGHEAKLGGWYGPRSDDRNEWLVHAGGALAVADRWRLEPTLFYSRNGLPGGTEWRALLAANHNLVNGWELGGGIAFGRAHSQGADAELREGFVRASVPLGQAWRLQMLARRESIQGGEATTVLAIGAALAWR